MAVRPPTAVPTQEPSDPERSAHPIRTCIGCRQKAPVTELLRVVAAPSSGSDPASPVPVRPDPRRRAPGRGAWLHRDPQCLELAERRRAFGRALRTGAVTDPAAVREFLAARQAPPSTDR